MKIVKNDKFKLSIVLLLILLSTTLMIIFKILNNIYFGNDEWKAKIGIVLESYVVDNWFVNVKNFFIGPIGFYSMVQSVLYSENSFLVPIFFHALINWVYVFTILLLVVLTFILFFLEQEKEELENIEANYTFKPYYKHQSIILINKKIIIEDKLIKRTSYDQVTKSYLIIKLTEMHPEQSKKTIIKIVNNLIKLIEQNILDGEEIIIHNFGKLVKVEKPAKQAINPATGEIVEVPITNVIRFKPSRNLKDTMSDTKWTGIRYDKKTFKKEIIE